MIRNKQLLEILREQEGFNTVMDMLERYSIDSIVIGICIKCESIDSSCEPDATENHCNNCDSKTVKSLLVLAGVV